MEYSEIMGFLSRINATLDAEGNIFVNGNCPIGHVTPEVIGNLEGIEIPREEVLSLNANPFGNELKVTFPEGFFVMKGQVGDVYTIVDTAADGAPYPTTPVAVQDALKAMYPTIDEDLFYEELSKTNLINRRMLGIGEGYIPITDKLEDTFMVDFQIRLNAAGITKGQMVSKDKFRSAINTLTDPSTGHTRNLFLEWLKSLTWDGTPRVRQWFKWGIGATAPVLEGASPEYEDKYLGDVSEAWFVGTVRKQLGPLKHEVVPVLVGDQGIGKSSFVRAMSFKPEWFADTSIEISDPIKFLESIMGAVVVELAEGTQFNAKDAAQLKSFVSKSEDVFRMPYATRPDHFQRHFSMISTSNNQKLFYDVTGNRRFYPMFCDVNKAHYLPGRDYDPDGRTFGFEVIEQLWAEAYVLEQQGRPHIVSQETKGLAEIVQEYCTVEDSGMKIINDFLDDPINGYATVGDVICKQIVMDFAWANRDVSERAKEEAWRTWVNGQKDWTSMNKQVRIGSIVTRSSYTRKYAPNERFKKLLADSMKDMVIEEAPPEVVTPLPPIPKLPTPSVSVEPLKPAEPRPGEKPKHEYGPDGRDSEGFTEEEVGQLKLELLKFMGTYGLDVGDPFDEALMDPELKEALRSEGAIFEVALGKYCIGMGPSEI